MAVSFFASSTEQTITLKLGKPSIQGIPKNYYILTLLEKSFAEVNVKLNIAYSIEPMNTKRILQELKRNGDVEVKLEGYYWIADDEGKPYQATWKVGDGWGPGREFYTFKGKRAHARAVRP